MAYSDGSRDELGRVASGWCGPRGAEGCVLVGTVATVWDGEIAGMRLVLESLLVAPVLLLSHSRAAIAAVCNAAACRWAGTTDLRAVLDTIRDWADCGMPLQLAWVKAHISILGNERADVMAKHGCRAGGDSQVTEGG